jgi:hypothetical protein
MKNFIKLRFIDFHLLLFKTNFHALQLFCVGLNKKLAILVGVLNLN